jgi:hypothetical protein
MQLAFASAQADRMRKDGQWVPFALRSCVTEDENEVVDGHIYDFLQSDAMLVCSFFEVSHVFKPDEPETLLI